MTIFQKLGVEINNPVDAGGNQRGSNMLDEMVWKTTVESVVGTFLQAGGYIFDTYANMDLVSSPPQYSMGWVIGDPDPALNGIYQKTSVGSTWTRVGDLPYSFIRLFDSGAGTANAIVAVPAQPLPTTPSAALLVMNVFETNTGNVTVNGKPLLTSSGNQIQPGGIIAGMFIAFLDTGTEFRMLSEQASAALLAQMEALALAAAASAAQAAASASSVSVTKFFSKAAAEAYEPISAPSSVSLTGFNTINEFGRDKQYNNVGSSEPSHGGKFMITLDDGVTDVWFEVDNTTEVTPAMYGGSIADAMTHGRRVKLSGSANLTAAVSVSNSDLEIVADNAEWVVTGAAGIVAALQLNATDNLKISGKWTIDCDNRAGIAIDVTANHDACVSIEGIKARNMMQVAPSTSGAGGIQVRCATASDFMAFCNVQWNDIDEVTRSVAGGICFGITAADARLGCVKNNKVNHIRQGGDNADADALKVFAQLLSGGNYDNSVWEVSNNDIRNWDGRAIKTQVHGVCTVSGNLMRIDDTISPITSFRVTDHQTLNVSEIDNKMELITAPNAGGTDAYMCQASMSSVLDYTRQPMSVYIARNRRFISKAFSDGLHANGFGRLYTLFANNGTFGVGNVSRKVAWTVENEVMLSDQVATFYRGGHIAFDCLVPVTWASGSSVHVKIHDNRVEANNFMLALPASGGTAAHGGLGDLTSKLFYDIKGNVLPASGDVPVMPYSSNNCFTSSIKIGENSIGTQANKWSAPFDFAQLLGGCGFYVGGTTTPAHAQAPTSFTFGVVSREGMYLTVKYYGASKTALTLSNTAVGAAPSWA